jgi:hypothetical protein
VGDLDIAITISVPNRIPLNSQDSFKVIMRGGTSTSDGLTLDAIYCLAGFPFSHDASSIEFAWTAALLLLLLMIAW